MHTLLRLLVVHLLLYSLFVDAIQDDDDYYYINNKVRMKEGMPMDRPRNIGKFN